MLKHLLSFFAIYSEDFVRSQTRKRILSFLKIFKPVEGIGKIAVGGNVFPDTVQVKECGANILT